VCFASAPLSLFFFLTRNKGWIRIFAKENRGSRSPGCGDPVVSAAAEQAVAVSVLTVACLVGRTSVLRELRAHIRLNMGTVRLT
jgi:hypothetical protein